MPKLFFWSIIVIVIIRIQICSSQDQDRVIQYLHKLARYLTNSQDSLESDKNKYRIIEANDLDEDIKSKISLRNGITLNFDEMSTYSFLTLRELLENYPEEKSGWISPDIRGALRNASGDAKNLSPRDTAQVRNISIDKTKEINVPEMRKFLTTRNGSLTSTRSPRTQTSKREKEKREQREREEKQYADCIKGIIDFLDDRQLSTKFIYTELKRIERTGVIRDEFRRLVFLFEHIYPEYAKRARIPRKVYLCFRESLRKIKENMDLWLTSTNNLIVDVFNDNIYSTGRK